MARRKQEVKEEDALTKTYNDLECVDAKGNPIAGKMKMFCPGCGFPRDPELAARLACPACLAPAGTELLKRQPVFDDDGNLLTGEAAKEYRKAQRARSKAAEDGEEVEAPIEVEAPVVVDIKPVLVPPAKPVRRNPNEIAPKSVVGFKANIQKPEELVVREMYPDRKAAAQQSLAELFL